MRNDHCTFRCYKQGNENNISYADLQSEPVICDFSKDTYNEILDMICSQKLEVFENKADENGKIIYEAVPCVVCLYLVPQEGSVYFKPLDNMDDIIARFESLKEAATKE